MLRAVSFNVNGLRSCLRKGLEGFLNDLDADIVMLQEIRIQAADIDLSTLLQLYPYKYLNYGQKPGYSGTAILSKTPLSEVIYESPELLYCDEGRYVFAQHECGLTIASVYLPSGTSSDTRQEGKLQSLGHFCEFLKGMTTPLLIAGDMNLTHRDIDLKNFKGNKEKPGCTTEERQLFSQILQDCGLIDCHRFLEPDDHSIYTWWTYRGQAFDKNVGWRIDYFLLSLIWQDSLMRCQVVSQPRLSDHAAIVLDIADR